MEQQKKEHLAGKRMEVRLDGRWIYDIVLDESFRGLPDELRKLNVQNRRICIVTDSNVAALYLEEVRALVESCCREVIEFVFPAGEEQKNLDTVRSLYRRLIGCHFDRKDLLLALGGGVTGDLCGFAAATYLRGVDFVQIPTTLLAQVDSSIGGKTGVDFESYKNMVGAFHMPKLVYENVSALQTLSDEQFSAGMGEVIKHGLIRDREYYEWIWNHRAEIAAREIRACEEMITGSNRIKREVVELDPTEQNERATLNFGHTLGHAIEKLKDFSMLHGHCVALGSLCAIRIGVLRGVLTPEEEERYRSLLDYFGLPAAVSGLEIGNIIEATKNDKKMEAGVIKFILLERVGRAAIDRTVTEREMKDGLAAILEEIV